ncbi:MAG: hypothetical protein KAG97_11925 [Victivallales bacterium]|nr:hypothetical protein [Victivallales bacterium]
MKKILLILLIVAIIAGGAFAWKRKTETPEAEAPKTKIVKVERGPISLLVEASGRVASNLDVDIKCKASGEIVGLPFDESDVVKKGELVVELDPVDEKRNVKKALVTLSSSKARLSKAKQNLIIAENNLVNSRRQAEVSLETAEAREKDTKSKEKRMKQLFEKKLAGAEAYETARTSSIQAAAEVEKAKIRIEELKTEEAALELKRQDVALAKADVESTRINLSIVEQRLEDTKVYSPIDGVITERLVQTGQIM